jgi:chaperonin GroES
MPSTNSTISSEGRILPIADYLLVAPDPKEVETEAGIVIPDASVQRPRIGTVVAVGRKVKENFPEIDIGTRLLWIYELYSYVEIGDTEYLLMTPNDVAAVLEPIEDAQPEGSEETGREPVGSLQFPGVETGDS